ncbi:MAG: YfhO family protein [Anaerolineae bacterium]|nr:YfhO family protein [Anaerolineae bacterium]
MTRDHRRCGSIAGTGAWQVDAGMLVLFGAAVALFFWPLWLLAHRFPIGGGDLWGQLHPVWSYIAEWLRRGVVPLWSTRMMGGDPIISEAQYGLVNPLNWPLFLASPIPPWLISLRGAASLWLAGSGLYLFLRRSPVWGLARAPAAVSAIVYMFSDPFIAHLGHPQFNDTIAWLPWALWGLDRAARVGRGIPLAASALAALWVSGHAQAALYATCLVAGYALWQTSEGGRRGAAGRRLGRLTLVAMAAAMLAAPGLLPALERYPYTDRAAVPPKEGEYEAHLGMWRDYISPLYHGRNVKAFWAPWERVESGSVGVVGLGLAVLGLVTDQRRRTAFLAGTALVAVLFALGTQGPLYPRLEHLPLFSATWKTGRAIFVLSFALAIAAGLGVQHLLRTRAGQTWGILAILAALTIGLRASAWAALAPSVATRAQALVGLQLAAVTLAGAGFLGIVARRHALGRAGLIAIALSDLVATGALADVEPMPRTSDDPHAAAIAYLGADEGWFRVDVDAAARGLWSPASVMAAGFDVPQGLGNPMEIVVYNQFYWGIPHKGMPAYNALGTKYVIVPKGGQPGADGIWPVFLDDPLIDVHLNTNALPRARLVYRVTPVTTLEAAFSSVLSPDFDPVATAVVTNGPKLGGVGQGRIEVLAYGPNRAAFAVTTTEPALLVLSDLCYPGWRARTNDAAATIYAADGIFRGVYVPEGDSHVEMRYVPAPLQVGLGLFGCGLLIFAAVRRCVHAQRRAMTQAAVRDAAYQRRPMGSVSTAETREQSALRRASPSETGAEP